MSDMSLHTPSGAGAIHGHSAADLAHFAGADELSAGVAVAGAGGRRLRARLLADELAAGHCVMMRLAAKADYAIGNAASMGDRFALPFDLLAARFAGTAGRLMDQFRRGALSLPKVAGPTPRGRAAGSASASRTKNWRRRKKWIAASTRPRPPVPLPVSRTRNRRPRGRRSRQPWSGPTPPPAGSSPRRRPPT